MLADLPSVALRFFDADGLEVPFPRSPPVDYLSGHLPKASGREMKVAALLGDVT